MPDPDDHGNNTAHRRNVGGTAEGAAAAAAASSDATGAAAGGAAEGAPVPEGQSSPQLLRCVEVDTGVGVMLSKSVLYNRDVEALIDHLNIRPELTKCLVEVVRDCDRAESERIACYEPSIMYATADKTGDLSSLELMPYDSAAFPDKLQYMMGPAGAAASATGAQHAAPIPPPVHTFRCYKDLAAAGDSAAGSVKCMDRDILYLPEMAHLGGVECKMAIFSDIIRLIVKDHNAVIDQDSVTNMRTLASVAEAFFPQAAALAGADAGAAQGAAQGATQGATQGSTQGATQGSAQGAAKGGQSSPSLCGELTRGEGVDDVYGPLLRGAKLQKRIGMFDCPVQIDPR
jgi:hypothetical protein